MFALLALMMAAKASTPLAEAYEHITPQVAAGRVARCGVGPATVRSDAELQTDVIVVADAGPISDQQIACIVKAASFYDVEVPPTARLRLSAIQKARVAAVAAAEGRKWLSDHKLLNRLPKYEPKITNDAKFASQIEDLCHAKGALHSRYGLHSISPDWAMLQFNAGPKDGPFSCILSVGLASGYELGFIGNEREAR